MTVKWIPDHGVAPVCGLCSYPKRCGTYNAAPAGVRMQMVWLCERCDLTPDPPLK